MTSAGEAHVAATLLLLASVPAVLVAIVLLWLSRRSTSAAGAAERRPDTPRSNAGLIRILAGTRAGEEVTVTDAIIIGRDPARANLVIPDPRQLVSGIHCEIGFDVGKQLFLVRDLQSRNGTILTGASSGEGRRLAAEQVEEIAPGGELILGTAENRLRLELG